MFLQGYEGTFLYRFQKRQMNKKEREMLQSIVDDIKESSHTVEAMERLYFAVKKLLI